jgi:hypothetical protein
MRDELEIHLSALKRQDIIDVWHDRKIIAGDDVDNEINEHLEEADVILILVSPYFIASNYCYDVEMKRAMERHENREATVIPVIIQPCDWHSTPFGKLLATPTDGNPISRFPNQHEGFLEVTKAIRTVTENKAQNPAELNDINNDFIVLLDKILQIIEKCKIIKTEPKMKLKMFFNSYEKIESTNKKDLPLIYEKLEIDFNKYNGIAGRVGCVDRVRDFLLESGVEENIKRIKKTLKGH